MSHFSTLQAGKFVAGQFPITGLLARNNFRLGRNPSRVDAKRGDHFLQADFPLLIAVSRHQITSVLSANLTLLDYGKLARHLPTMNRGLQTGIPICHNRVLGS